MRYILSLSLVASLGLVSCEKEAEIIEVSNHDETRLEMASLKADLAKLEKQLIFEQNERFRAEAKQTAALTELTAVMKEIAESKDAEPVVKTTVVPVVIPKEDHAEERRVSRLKAEGEELAYLKTTAGDEYHELVISRVTDIGVVFRHRGGIARIPFAELPVAWQDRFYYDRDRALAALKRERVAQARYARAVEEDLAAKNGEKAKKEVDANLERLAVAVEDLQRQAAAAPQPVNHEDEIIVNPPIIIHDNTVIQDDLYCPPVIRHQVVRTPSLRVPTIRNGNSGRLETPRLQQTTPLCPTPTTQYPNTTTQRPSSISSRTTPTVTRSRPTIRRSTSTPTVRRPSSTPTTIPRSSPTPRVQRSSTPSRSSTSRSTYRPPSSTPSRSTPSNSRTTIRRR